jgi:hypothetical protein
MYAALQPFPVTSDFLFPTLFSCLQKIAQGKGDFFAVAVLVEATAEFRKECSFKRKISI